MARKGNRNRGIVFKEGGWWVRLYVNGQEKWYRTDNKTQARAVYSRIKTEQREGRYFPEKFDRRLAITLRAWLKQCLEGITSPGLRNMRHYGKFWSKLLGQHLLTKISADDLRHIQSRMAAKATRSPHTINRYFAALRRFLNLAIAEGFLLTNPVKGVKFFPEPTGRLRFLTDSGNCPVSGNSFHQSIGRLWPSRSKRGFDSQSSFMRGGTASIWSKAVSDDSFE